MKRIISITNINIDIDSSEYEIANTTTYCEEAMQQTIRHMAWITQRRYGTMNSWLVPDNDKQANLIEIGGQQYHGYNADYANQLFDYGSDDSVHVTLTEIKYPDSILIVLDDDYYKSDYVKVHDGVRCAIIDDLLLTYLPMEFRYGCPQ